ncbi:MAG TPA: urease accessory protein UreJ [Cyanobacteria bacterium UBA11149]|nr:urease accessory protein UreJ [Cyanobacteria bacterium UBA11367]HBE56062.1 urease accessory protein UreJ [Cyanobacteria bacterium UBA11366]HBK64541.1 urease accessory protein UreJ [Cyanobacteria bacterium UBA11166]HBR73738.1 urease accessory protein UreJ [Cyanobacteria bacterium UBA11159]HBS70980.1 urease accessory protein UreJ [Cyanobacteria bacterium UBA11153]HBW92353.1 urease accessory protein UreJ [Cyanobacteria bacterium UBA11149]HCA97818.1 urease accessory protein UreJ [Cyanobacteria
MAQNWLRQAKKSNIYLRPKGVSLAIASFICLGLLMAANPAMAHHAMGGRIPANFFEGFISGLAHPVIGLDHLAVVLAMGFLCVGKVQGFLMPGGFLLAAMGGTGIHLLRMDLPGSEIIIAISAIALGAILSLEKSLSFILLFSLVTIAGLFHGYAYGEAIVGAQMTPLVGYLLGFTLIQYGVAMLAFWIGSKGMKKSLAQTKSLMRYCGYAVCAIGFVFLTVSLGS